ncbi:MAG: RNA polymerase sigma factor [Clostridia bacterium]|nr:RNA polymerase sigma factor [Clostridia bacterium]
MLIVYTLTESVVRSRDERADELIKRMAEGDVSAMGGLYDLLKNDVYAFALSKTANKENAEDITHDTFVQIWKSAARYKSEGKPLAWIFTIEMNLFRRQCGKNNRIISFDDLGEMKSEESDFSERVVNGEFLRQLFRVLCEDEREIISLHVVSGLKFREIAKLVGKPLSTVMSKYSRAIKKLQLQIKEEAR